MICCLGSTKPLISSTKVLAPGRDLRYVLMNITIVNKANRRAISGCHVSCHRARLDTDRLVAMPSCGKKQGSDMAGHRGSQWTAEEDRRLRDLIRMNKSWVLISAALSRSVKSIRDRARHLERQAKMESAGLDADRAARIEA
jgi:Myb-like DNA-binding domain